MSVFLNVRQDGSLALFIDGDLQFDQRDEKIYHQGLALPALMLAGGRSTDNLKALIIGGGDGLTARELLKSPRIASVDLVDYSPEVLGIGREKLGHLNLNSLIDTRVKVHVQDAWQYVQNAREQGILYDLVIVDLTVARDEIGAKFHSVEWYKYLAAVLAPQGILCSNCVSPGNTPHAYWSIFNSMRSAGLSGLPLRVSIPSFRQLGYGPDWGFMLASKAVIAPAELTLLDSPANERIKCDLFRDCESLKRLFQFPAGFENLQPASEPAANGSSIFLKYLQTDLPYATTGKGTWSAIDSNLEAMVVPRATTGIRHFLPPEIRVKLAEKTASVFPSGGQELLNEVMSLLPTLQPAYTRSIIAEFLMDPASFLEGIDLQALVNKLVERAAELPQRIAAELVLLQERLLDWAGDWESLLEMGRRVVTALAVVVILANFIYPDSAYGKGGHGGHGHHGHHANHGWNRGWGHDHGRYGGWGRPNHWRRGWGGYGWGWGGGWGGGPYYYASGPAYTSTNYSTNQMPDSQGNQYPVRAYVQTYGNVPDQPWTEPAGGGAEKPAPNATASVSGNVLKSAYRLGPDVDILSDGSTVVTLTDNAYLKVKAKACNLVDQQTGRTLISLYSDPTLTWHLSSELKHQAAGLKKAAQSKEIEDGAETDENSQMPAEVMETARPAAAAGESADSADSGSSDDASDTRDDAEMANMITTAKLLDKAETTIGDADEKPPEATAPPVEGAFELFNSAWADHQGKYVILKRADGSLVYGDGKFWYSDEGKTKLEQQYSPKLKEAISGYLAGLAKDTASSKDSLTQEQQEVQTRLDKFKAHLAKLQADTTGTAGTTGSAAPAAGSQDLVQFGTKQIPRAEAIKRMDNLIKRAEKHFQSVQTEIDNLPAETEALNKLMTNFQS